MIASAQEWQWECARDADEVHDLLEASDREQASEFSPAPHRNRKRTNYLVANGCVHLLRMDGMAAAMFTLTDTPPFDLRDVDFPTARRPLYLQRLAIAPDCIRTSAALPGINALRRAIEVGRDRGADALRSQANPDLKRTMKLLSAMDFRQFPAMGDPATPRRIYMERRL